MGYQRDIPLHSIGFPLCPKFSDSEENLPVSGILASNLILCARGIKNWNVTCWAILARYHGPFGGIGFKLPITNNFLS
jgi:hypothetical protein